MTNAKKIIFFGNTKYSLIGATIIHKQLSLAQIVTIPNSPLTTFAREHNIPCFIIKKIDEAAIENLATLHPDFFVVEDYGHILPEILLSIPKKACLNIHHSLLPKYRGPSPAPSALLAGEETTGVTIMKMTKKVDAGDILKQKTYTMKSDETTDSLLTTLNTIGAELLVDVINDYEKITPQPQKEQDATYTTMMKKEDGFITTENPPARKKLDRMIRAYYPWPGVWTHIRIKNQEVRIKLLPNIPSLRESDVARDESISSKFLIQVEGKKPISIKDFINGYPEIKEQIKKILPFTS